MAVFSIPRVAIPANLLLSGGERHPGEIYVMERVPLPWVLAYLFTLS